jgi:hypothetical protein
MVLMPDDKDVATVGAVRAMIGPGVKLMVDYKQSLGPAEACRRIARLAEYDLHWVEEPVQRLRGSGVGTADRVSDRHWLLARPPELGAVGPDAVQNDGQLPSDRDVHLTCADSPA